MDLRMPGVNGAAAIRALAERQIPSRVLVLTTYDSDSDVVPAIEAGATGYLLKDSPRDELFRAVRAASRGESVLASSVATRLMSQLRGPGAGRAQRPRARGALTHRPGRDEPRRGGAAVHLRGDGQDAPAPHLREAQRQRPGRGRRDGLRARAAADGPRCLTQGRGSPQTWGATPSASCCISSSCAVDLEQREVAAGDELHRHARALARMSSRASTSSSGVPAIRRAAADEGLVGAHRTPAAWPPAAPASPTPPCPSTSTASPTARRDSGRAPPRARRRAAAPSSG